MGEQVSKQPKNEVEIQPQDEVVEIQYADGTIETLSYEARAKETEAAWDAFRTSPLGSTFLDLFSKPWGPPPPNASSEYSEDEPEDTLGDAPEWTL